MKDELKTAIREARRKLQLASGAPLTEEEQAEERRQAEIEAMEMEMFDKFGPRFIGVLRISVISKNDVVVVEIKANGHTFQLRKGGRTYVLVFITEQGEIDLVRLDSSEPEFANRVLVAIGDALAEPNQQLTSSRYLSSL